MDAVYCPSKTNAYPHPTSYFVTRERGIRASKAPARDGKVKGVPRKLYASVVSEVEVLQRTVGEKA